MDTLLPIIWDDEKERLLLLDQRRLPHSRHYESYGRVDEVYGAIKTMVVRGAPAIGVSAAYGMALGAKALPDVRGAFFTALHKQAELLRSARPTAVNLCWAVDRMVRCAEQMAGQPIACIRSAMLSEAKQIHDEDISICRRIGETLLPLLHDGMSVLTHCNAGQLAASQYGTALAPIYLAMEKGMRIHVYADETRPRLQGAMLTAYELHAAGADVTVLCDNMAASVMGQHKIDCCIVGCDRVARNGDVANKIGTLNVAILARHFDIPFYVAAPTPTIDPSSPDGKGIPIEEREEKEVSMVLGNRITPEGVHIINPAFDVTPNALITGIATEYGMIYPPFEKEIEKIMQSSRQ